MAREAQTKIAATVERIEALVRERQARAATSEIRKLLRSPAARGEPALVIEACDWYRRLGLFREAFLLVADLLADPLQTQKTYSTRAPKGRQLLWAARLLNLMGASSQALSLARKLAAHDAPAHQVLGNIFLANFEYAQALPHFEAMNALDDSPGRYRSAINRLSQADALAGLGRFDAAVAIAQAIAGAPRPPAERLLTGLALQAWGEYLARAGRDSEAWALLERATPYFPPEDRSPDRAVLDKWRGYVAARQGRRASGLALIHDAIAVFRVHGARAEAWLDCYRLLHELGALSPLESARLRHYPGLSAGALRVIGVMGVMGVMGSAGVAGKADSVSVFGPRAAPLQVDLAAGECVLGGARYLGVSQELKLAGALAIAGDWGLSLERAKALLWPNETHAYPQLEPRLHKIIKRLRSTYDLEITVEHRAILLTTAAAERIFVRTAAGEADARPSFLRERAAGSEFTAADLSDAYSIKRSQRAEVLKDWRGRGWIAPIGAGAKLRYRVVGTDAPGSLARPWTVKTPGR